MAADELHSSPMELIRQIRRDNLRWLKREYGGNGKLAELLGWTNGGYLSQLIGKNPMRHVSETVARRIEHKLNLPLGWLDSHRTDQ